MRVGKPVAVYTDAGLLTHNPSKVGGTWAYVMVDKNDRVVSEESGITLVEGLKISAVSSIVMEQIAMVKAIEALPEGWVGTIHTDCQCALMRVESDYDLTHGVNRFPVAENNLPGMVSRRSKRAVERLGSGVVFVLLQGHPTKADLKCGIGKRKNMPVSEWNVRCDDLCNAAKTFHMMTVKIDNLIKEVGPEEVRRFLEERSSEGNEHLTQN